jgi:hypothetical protein
MAGLLAMPSELHGLIYSQLESKDKLNFLLISREIHCTSRSYREMRLRLEWSLSLSCCNFITDAGLAHLSGVHTLNLSYCLLITDAGLTHLRSVHTLNLSGCQRITDDGLTHSRVLTLFASEIATNSPPEVSLISAVLDI